MSLCGHVHMSICDHVPRELDVLELLETELLCKNGHDLNGKPFLQPKAIGF